MRAPAIHAVPVWGLRLQTALVVFGAGIVALFAGTEVAEGNGKSLSPALIGLAALAGASVLLSMPSQQLFLGWLFVAPLVQGNASTSELLHTLNLALYHAPALVLAVTAAWRLTGTRLAWFDALPFAYLLVALGSLVLTTDSFTADPIGALRSFFITTVIPVIAYYFVIVTPTAALGVKPVVTAIVGLAALQAVMAIVEWRTGWLLWGESWWRGEVSRSVATLSNPSVLGTVIGIGLVWALAVLLWEGPRQAKRLCIAMVVLASPALFATLTRAPIIAAILVAIPLILLSPRARWPALVLTGAAVVALVASWGAFASSNVYEQRLGRQDTAETRLYLQRAALSAASERPVFGWGYGSFDRVKDLQTARGADARLAVQENTSHNSFLTVLVELGGVGLALLVLPWIAIAIAAVRNSRVASSERWIFVGGVATLSVYVLNAAIIDMRFFSFAPALLWVVLGLTRRALAESA